MDSKTEGGLMNEKLTVNVIFSPTELPKVIFIGPWTRKDIDKAYASMLRTLPTHLTKLKAKEAANAK